MDTANLALPTSKIGTGSLSGSKTAPLALPTSKIVRYKASAPTAQYLGVTLRAFTDYLRPEVTSAVLKKFYLEEIIPGMWFDAQSYLDILREIETYSPFEELVAVGVKSTARFPLPPHINSVGKYLEAAPQMIQLYMRDTAPEERITVEKRGITHYRLIYNVPLPPFLMYGLTYGMVRRVKRQDQSPVLTILEHHTPYSLDVMW